MPLLTLCVLIEIFAGQILQNGQDTLFMFPIFLISIPVINGVGGNIGSVLGARLASGLHVGYVTISLKDKEMHSNFIISIIIGIVIYFVLSIIIYFSYSFILTNNNIEMEISLFLFVFIITGAGLLLVCIVCIASIFTAFWSFRKGLDPDDMVAPVVTTVGDVMGIIFLFLFIKISGII